LTIRSAPVKCDVISMSKQIPDNFFIKRGYKARPQPEYFVDKATASGHPVVWQPEVYAWARKLANQLGCKRIIDLGSGNGEKLSKMHPDFEIVGVDFGANLDYCREHYPYARWLEANFEEGEAVTVDLSKEVISESVVICSDVIEHLKDPLPLLRGLRILLEDAPIAVLSTPERLLAHGFQASGPPTNPCHTREWRLGELTQLLKACDFQIIHAGLTRTNDAEPFHHTSLHLLSKPGRQIQLSETPGSVSTLHYWGEAIVSSIKISRGRKRL